MVAALYGWYYQDILRYLLSLTRERQQAKDLTQETFLRAMSRADILQEMEKAACRAWLYKTARNLFIDQARRQRHERELLAQSPPEVEASIEEDSLWVDECLGQLPEQDAALFRLRYLEGHAASDLARRFGLPAATVRTRLARARKRLKQLWLDEQEEDHDET